MIVNRVEKKEFVPITITITSGKELLQFMNILEEYNGDYSEPLAENLCMALSRYKEIK